MNKNSWGSRCLRACSSEQLCSVAAQCADFSWLYTYHVCSLKSAHLLAAVHSKSHWQLLVPGFITEKIIIYNLLHQ